MTKLFLDGGDPEETKRIDDLLKKSGSVGIDGQTTNPSLIAKNLYAKVSKKLTSDDAFAEYKRIVVQMAKVTHGPLSIQVIGSPDMTSEEMLVQARDRITWIPNAVIKFPCTTAGLTAVETFCQEGPVNITLNFSQEQAAAVYAATKYHAFDVFISPFVGRIDDTKQNGMDVVSNILEMYKALGDGHVQVLTASVRSLDHMKDALFLKSHCITAPSNIIEEWVSAGKPMPEGEFIYDVPTLEEIPYKEMTLDLPWREYDLHHNLTDAGVRKFWQDWSSLVE